MKHARTILAAAGPAVILMTAGLTGCDDDDDNNGASMSSGVLIDALVTGINYRCGSATSTSGTTNAAGMYTCPTGQSVSFYVGDILVGTIPTTLPKATPLDLAGNGSTVTDAEVTNITRFLMSISSTNPNTGTITIPASVHTTATGMSLDFNTVTAGVLASTISSIAPAGSTLFTDLQAQAHLTASVNSLFAGTYSGSFNGSGSSGTWNLTINSSGGVSGSYIPTGGSPDSLTGTMLPTLTTGGRYTFAGTTGGGATWGGYLDVGTGAFNGTWAGGSSQGVYMGSKQ